MFVVVGNCPKILWCWRYLQQRDCFQMQTQDRISQLAEAPTSIHTGIVIKLQGYLLDADCRISLGKRLHIPDYQYRVYFLWIQSNLNNFFRVWWGGEGWSWGEITVYYIERFHCIRKQTKEMMMTKLKAMRSSLLSSEPGLNIYNGWNSSFHMQRWVMFSSSQKYVFFYSLFGADIINLLKNFLAFFPF